MRGYNTSNTIFGGKIIAFGGDFRQILLVVSRGSLFDIIHATINLSYIWDCSIVIRLTKNMRLQQSSMKSSDYELEQFSNWILKDGDGKLGEPNDGYANIDIPPELLITNFVDPLEAIVQYTYPNFEHNYHNEHFL